MDTIIIDRHRAGAYTGLALGFDRPNAELFEALDSGELATALAGTGEAVGSDELAEAAYTLASIDHEPDAIEQTYASAFGLEAESGLPLYEVAYVPGSLVTNTDILADISGFYRAFGLAAAQGSRDRVDALSTQLEFLGFLAMRRATYREEGPEAGVEVTTDATTAFLEDHLGRWVPRFVLDVLDEVDDPTYRCLADALGALIEADLARFDLEPEVYRDIPAAPMASVAGLDPGAGRVDLACGAGPALNRHTPEVDQ